MLQLCNKDLKLGTSESKHFLSSSTVILLIFYEKNANHTNQIHKENIRDNNPICNTVITQNQK